MSLLPQSTDSGIQLMMVLGVVLLVTAAAPQLGMQMIGLAIVAWAIYNLLNIGRQF